MLASIRSRRNPALLTSTSSRPNSRSAVAISAPAPSHDATSSRLATARPPAATISATTSSAGPAAPPLPSSADADVVDDDGGALSGERERVRAADAAAGSGHDDDAPVAQTHQCSFVTLAASRKAGRSPPPCASKRRAADVRGQRRGEEGDAIADLDRLGQPAERDGARDRGDAGLVAVVQVRLLGADHPGHDRVHPHLRRPLDRQRRGEAVEAGLGGAVGRRARRWAVPADAADHHDRAAARAAPA